MKRIIVFCLICCLFTTSLFADKPVTRYYTQLKIVTKDRKERKGDGKGQFITFNDKGCYDSDKSGYTVNNGFLKYGKTSNDRIYYSGNSYWGEAMYIFTENYGRINIVTLSDSTTYVYVLATPPKDTYTCALIKETKTNPVNPPVNPVNPPINPINPVNPITDKNKSKTAKQKYVTKEENCHICYGSGKCSRCNGNGIWYPSYTQKAAVCTACTNGKCSTCRGTGKVSKGEWITVYE